MLIWSLCLPACDSSLRSIFLIMGLQLPIITLSKGRVCDIKFLSEEHILGMLLDVMIKISPPQTMIPYLCTPFWCLCYGWPRCQNYKNKGSLGHRQSLDQI